MNLLLPKVVCPDEILTVHESGNEHYEESL